MRIVKHIQGYAARFSGEPYRGWLPRGAATPPDTPRETIPLDLAIIEQDEAGYLLEWTGPSPRHSGDTWHASVEEAVAQADTVFGVAPDQWSEGAPGGRRTV